MEETKAQPGLLRTGANGRTGWIGLFTPGTNLEGQASLDTEGQVLVPGVALPALLPLGPREAC